MLTIKVIRQADAEKLFEYLTGEESARAVSAHHGHTRASGDNALNNDGSIAKAAGGYYLGPDGEPEREIARWFGQGVTALGLGETPIDKRTMLLLGKGLDPNHPKRQLVMQAGGQHVAAMDMTFSADKSVSVLWARADEAHRAELAAAHQAAVDEALRHIEDRCELVRRKQHDHVWQEASAGIIAAAFDHETSRQSESNKDAGQPPDMNLHSHVVVFNVVWRRGWVGRNKLATGAFESKAAFDMRREAGAIYRATLGHQLQELGYATERGKDTHEQVTDYVQVAGVPKEIKTLFSSRHDEVNKEVERFTEEVGRAPTVLEARDFATKTRQAKEAIAEGSLFAAWQARLDKEGFTEDQAATLRVKDRSTTKRTATDVLNRAVAEVAKAEGIFAWRFLAAQIAIEAQGHLDPAELRTLLDNVDQAKGDGRPADLHADLVAVVSPRQKGAIEKQAILDDKAKASWLASEAKIEAMRKEGEASIKAMPNVDNRKAARKELNAAIRKMRQEEGTPRPQAHRQGQLALTTGTEINRGNRCIAMFAELARPERGAALVNRLAEAEARICKTLSPDQRVAFGTMARTAGAGVLEAPAGSGKGVVMQAYAEAWRLERPHAQVVAVAVAASRAEAFATEISGTGYSAEAFAHAVSTGTLQLRHDTLIVVDEAGMAETYRLETVLDAATRHKASVALVGDRHQLRSIEAGGLFEHLADEAEKRGELAELSRNQRARHEDDAAAWERLRHGHADSALGHFVAQNQVVITATTKQAIDELVARVTADRVAEQARCDAALGDATSIVAGADAAAHDPKASRAEKHAARQVATAAIATVTPASQLVIVEGDNTVIDDLNAAIQKAIIDHPTPTTISARHLDNGIDPTASVTVRVIGDGYERVEDLHAGDRVATTKWFMANRLAHAEDRVTATPARVHVKNGVTARVVAVDAKARTVSIQLDHTAKVVQVSGDGHLRCLRLDYARHISRAQGTTVDRAYVMSGGWHTDARSAYVAVSRAREATVIVASQEALGLDPVTATQAETVAALARRWGQAEQDTLPAAVANTTELAQTAMREEAMARAAASVDRSTATPAADAEHEMATSHGAHEVGGASDASQSRGDDVASQGPEPELTPAQRHEREVQAQAPDMGRTLERVA